MFIGCIDEWNVHMKLFCENNKWYEKCARIEFGWSIEDGELNEISCADRFGMEISKIGSSIWVDYRWGFGV